MFCKVTAQRAPDDGNIDILRLDGDALTKVASLALPGHPASMRGSTP